MVNRLLRIAINAHREAAIAQALVAAALPVLADETRQRVRREIGKAYDELLVRLDDAPGADTLEWLRLFDKPPQ